jgi:hypothetical protein
MIKARLSEGEINITRERKTYFFSSYLACLIQEGLCLMMISTSVKKGLSYRYQIKGYDTSIGVNESKREKRRNFSQVDISKGDKGASSIK